jgi:EAL domain-containing protein (putative c-di-GMP-specific phosphodiesterase class I)/AmiR/NasT family two-component response regulator
MFAAQVVELDADNHHGRAGFVRASLTFEYTEFADFMPDSAGPLVLTSALVVEDSALQRGHAADLCREFGITRIEEASNGQEALALLDVLSAQPDLLIVDLEMPTMDGAELLEHLARRGIGIPIIIASSRGSALLNSVQDMGSAVGLHVVAALKKPLQIGTLREALGNVNRVKQRLPRQANKLPIDVSVLRAGIDAGEILVHYQPKVDIVTGDVRGLEALARWQHPTLGLVPPDEFIGVAEQNNLIHELTMQVMNQALFQTAVWNMCGLDLSIAINLSPLLLNRSEILDEIASLQQSHEVPAENIVLEVTETSLVRELAVALGVLTRLRLRGFGVSLDDYGTGFSSMQQLARIPFTELKIDRSFVHGAHGRESLQVILRSALELANELGLSTVAEGIEHVEDWRLLQEYGCTLGQGWLIAKPMSADEFLPWLKKYEAHQATLSSGNATARRAPRL